MILLIIKVPTYENPAIEYVYYTTQKKKLNYLYPVL